MPYLVVSVALQIEPYFPGGVTEVGDAGVDQQYLVNSVNILCLIHNPPADIMTRWLYGTSVYMNSSANDRHSVTFYPGQNVSELRISNLGYADNGTYVCEAKSAADDMWLWAIVELVLQG